MANQQAPELMTVKETAAYLRIPVPTVYYHVKRGTFPAVQIGGRWRVKRKMLHEQLQLDEETTKPTVLVVDDDPAIQKLLEKYLSDSGYNHIVAGTGEEALKVMKSRQIDFLFLDLDLPDITGDKLHDKIKADHPDLPTAIITGYPDSEILSRILQSGPVAVVKKPLNFDLVGQTLKIFGSFDSEETAVAV